MSTFLSCKRCKLLFALVLVLVICLAMLTGTLALQMGETTHMAMKDYPFSVLILGDSQMAGAGWSGGYANCITKAYPNAKVVNLAKNGTCLYNGEIRAQWEYYLSQGGFPEVDFVLLDGGVNDLSRIKKAEDKEACLDRVKYALSDLVEQIHEVSPKTQIIYVLMPPLAEWKDAQDGLPTYNIQRDYWKQLNILASTYDYVTVLDMFSLNPFSFPCTDCYGKNLADSVHLNETGYKNTFEYINNILVAGLTRNLYE